MVVAISLLLALLGFAIQPQINWGVLVVLVGFAALSQLLRLRLFATGDLSIAAALIFTAALLTGIPGLTFVSLAIVLTSLLNRDRDLPTLWSRKLDLAYDWAIGLLAGLSPALLTPLFDLSLSLNHLPLLIVPFFLMMLAYSYSGVGHNSV